MSGTPGTASVDEQGLRRIRAVTRNFTELQGLRESVPIGVCFAGMGVAMAQRGRTAIVLILLSVAVGGLLQLTANRFYRRRFGEVDALGAGERWEPAPAAHRQRYFGGIEGWPVVLPAFRGELPLRPARPWRWKWPFLGLMPLAVRTSSLFLPPAPELWLISGGLSAFLLWRWTRMELRLKQLHYPMLALLLLVVAPLFGPDAASIPVLNPIRACYLLEGAVLILVGLFDHLTLTHVLPPTPPDAEPGAAEETR